MHVTGNFLVLELDEQFKGIHYIIMLSDMLHIFLKWIPNIILSTKAEVSFFTLEFLRLFNMPV
jgi:hypothetical protein